MKRIVIMVIMGFFLGPPVFADPVDEGLPGADDTLKAQTRAMIQAGVQAEDAIDLTLAMMQQQFTHQQMLQAGQMVMAAAENGLPVKPITSKAQEGAAKQIQADRILAAMERVRQRYEMAYAYADRLTLKGQARMRTGNRMAEGMAAGLNQTDCDRIADQLRQRSSTMRRANAEDLAVESFAMVRDLARRGVSSKNSADVVCAALQHQYQAEQMQQLRRQFRTRAGQMDPRELARQFTYSFQQGRDPSGEWSGGAEGSGNSGGSSNSGSGGSSSNSGSGGSGGSSGSGGSGGGSGSGGGKGR